jgi:cytochrome c oxidase cbb3-type subunit 3
MHVRPRGIVTYTAVVLGVALMGVALVQAQGRGRGAGASPASQPPPRTATPQTYSAADIAAGQAVFAKRCAACHGVDAAGAGTGPDLTRSTLVAEDVRGDRIGPVVRTGRGDMAAVSLSAAELAAVVAFVHDRQTTAQGQLGGRRSVDAADLQTGDAAAGRRYFDASCTRCHSATGDLAGIGNRLQGLALLQRMLYPASGGGGAVTPARVTVTLPSGNTVSGALVSRDEFTIALRDADGWHRSWPTRQVTFTVDDPLEGHVEQLGRYTDTNMHDVYAYLQSLR